MLAGLVPCCREVAKGKRILKVAWIGPDRPGGVPVGRPFSGWGSDYVKEVFRERLLFR